MRIRRIAIILILSIMLITNSVYAKYVYQFEDMVINLTRDGESPICNVTYSTQEWTNQNVMITITSNKEIEQVSGFELSEDRKVLTKEITENEKDVIIIRDLSGNETEVEYEVNNIDKEPPQIIGCENGGIYKKPLILDYYDNVEIKDIDIDRYDSTLNIEYHSIYFDSSFYYGVDRTKSTLSIKVTGHPKGTRKYKYYANNKLYATTTDTNYTYTGLNKGTTYELKVQAIDSMGNVLEEKKESAVTSFYGSIVSTKNDEKFSATFKNLDSSVKKIRYAVWNYYEESNVRWYDATISNNSAVINCLPFNTNYYASYVVHAYMYDANNNVLDVLGFSIDFKTNHTPSKPTEIDKYQLTQNGNYQIIVSDLAGNKTIYEIKVK